MKTTCAGIGLMILLVATPIPLTSQEASRGRLLIEHLDRSNRGYGAYEVDLEMLVIGSDDDAHHRAMTVRGLESDRGDHTLIVLKRPVDLAGTTFLSVLARSGSRAQWIYLPSSRRARRIGGGQSDDAFLGSHFTYADMSPPAVDGFRYRWIRDQEFEGAPVTLVERCEAECGDDSARELLWVDTGRHVLRRVEFFGADGVRQRSLYLGEYTEVNGFWRPALMEMLDLQAGERTELRWTNWRMGVDLKERDFDSARLGRRP